LLIEEYALLTESAPDLRKRLDEWFAYYRPESPGECELLELAVMASVQWRRVHRHQTAIVNQKIRTAVFDFDCAQEDEVERYRAMLRTSPGAAVLGLKRSALGLRLLIARWERLLRLLDEEGTLYGNDRNEMINCQGARATPTEVLFESEGAYLTWLYCLMAQPAPRDSDFVTIGNERWMPTGLNDRNPFEWLGEKHVCRRILKELVEQELASVRRREARLRSNYEDPARDDAELRRQVLATPEGTLLLRHERTHGLMYKRAYEAFLKGRAQSLKTGRPPGAPDQADAGGADPARAAAPGPAADPAAAAAAVAEARARRKREADAVAPGVDKPIGAPEPPGDFMREEVRKARPRTCATAAGTSPAASEGQATAASVPGMGAFGPR
jgi:hypothetical protein